MKITDKIRDILKGKLPLFTLILFIAQPIMDVLSFWILKLGISNTITLLLRLSVLAVMVLTAFALSQKKKVYYITAAVCAFIGICHMVACFHFGYQSIITDMSNYIRVLQLPLTAICLITFIRQDEECYEAIKKGFVLNILIILAVQVLSIITGTEPHTYADGAGYIGWFSNTNTQSSILTMIAPVASAWLYMKKKLKTPVLWIVLIGSSLSMFFIGTRLAFAGIIATCFGLGASLLIVRIKEWKQAICFFLAGIIFIVALPLAPMMGHRQNHSAEMDQKQDWLQNQLDKPKDEPLPDDGEPPLAGEPLNLTPEQLAKVEELTPVYAHYVSDFFTIFGAERTIHMFNYTTDIRVLTATRDKKLMFAQALMDASPVTAKLFGVELTRFTIKGYNYDVENDFHGIYYLYGILGLVSMIAFIGYFILITALALIRSFKQYFTFEAAGWGIALIMCLGHCYFTAGVLRRPSASFYLAAILAGIFYLVKMKKYDTEV